MSRACSPTAPAPRTCMWEMHLCGCAGDLSAVHGQGGPGEGLAVVAAAWWDSRSEMLSTRHEWLHAVHSERCSLLSVTFFQSGIL